MTEDGEYPIDCGTCGEAIYSEEQDFNGMCAVCYDTAPEELLN